MKVLLAAASAAFALACASSATAATVVIDFSEYAFSSPGPYGEVRYSSMTTQGFSITNSLNALYVRSVGHVYNPDKTGANLNTGASGLTRFQRVDGLSFNLESLDFADFSNDGSNTSFALMFFDGIATGTRILQYDTKRGFQTADLGLRNLQWFSINTQTQIDNIVYSDVPTGVVPEPATWALMIMGFGAAGATLRRRRTTACAV